MHGMCSRVVALCLAGTGMVSKVIMYVHMSTNINTSTRLTTHVNTAMEAAALSLSLGIPSLPVAGSAEAV